MSRRILVAVGAGVLVLGGVTAGSSSAETVDRKRTQITVKDKRGDAHPGLDIQRVKVRNDGRYVVVRVKIRKLNAKPDNGRMQSSTGVHFDLGGDGRPEHLVALQSFHFYSGSTSDWNELRISDEEFPDPYGDWTDCFPNKPRKLVQSKPRRGELVFNAPKKCLGKPARLRVAVQTYRDPERRGRPDWARKARSYSRWLTLR